MQSKTTHPPYRLGFNDWAKYIRAEVERMAYGKEVRMAKPVLSGFVVRKPTMGLTKDGKTFILE